MKKAKKPPSVPQDLSFEKLRMELSNIEYDQKQTRRSLEEVNQGLLRLREHLNKIAGQLRGL